MISIAIKEIVDENSKSADPWTMVLSNLTRSENLVEEIIVELEKESTTVPKLLEAFTKLDYNKQNMKLHYLGKREHKVNT